VYGTQIRNKLNMTILTEIISGEGISVDSSTGKVIITNTMPNRNTFNSINVNNDTIKAQHQVDTLTLKSGNYINLDVDQHNTITISIDTKSIKGNFISDYISTVNFKLFGDTTELEKEFGKIITEFSHLSSQANLIRTEMVLLHDQIENLNPNNYTRLEEIQAQLAEFSKVLLDIDIRLTAVSRTKDRMHGALTDPSCLIGYDPRNMTVNLTKPLNSPVILENLTLEQRNHIAYPQNGRIIYNISANVVQVYSNNTWVNLY